ncbi:MAG: DUF3313 domain-containing protein [Phycisphaerae bacterium]|nr:DUF3313 domain-containing protein [Phycisphaerae bacterium]
MRRNSSCVEVARACRLALSLAGLSAVWLSGCTSSGPEFSGFLGDYTQIKPRPDMEAAFGYINPARSLAEYDKFLLDEVRVHFAPGAEGVAIDPDKLKELTDYFEKEARKRISKGYDVVGQPGPGVLRLRVAITDVKQTTAWLNIHPATKLAGAGLGSASLEAEGVDSQTGERVFAAVDKRPGNRLSVKEGFEEFGHAKQVMVLMIDRFIKRLDEAHGRRP